MKCLEEDFKRFYKLVESGQLHNNAAAKACNYTPEQFSRLRKKYSKIGDRMFIHGLSGKKSNHTKLTAESKHFIVEQYLIESSEINPINFKYWRDELEEVYDIKVSYKTVYNVLTAAGINSPEKRKVKRAPVKRISFRRKNFGELLQWDATPYQWFAWAGDTRYYALHGVMDDSRSTYLALYMTEFECRYGYIECRRQVLTKYGVELEDYSDKSPVFHNNYKDQTALSIADQLAGTEKKKALWEIMNQELDVDLHLANSPQAKGKIERGWETIQGRLVNEFKKRGIKTIEAANPFLENEFCGYYFKHFGKNKENVSVFRTLDKGINLKNLLCVKEKRTVNREGCISFKGLKIKVLNFQHTQVEGDLCINQNGLWFLYKGQNYAVQIKSPASELSADVPQVLENIIHDYLFSEMHFKAA